MTTFQVYDILRASRTLRISISIQYLTAHRTHATEQHNRVQHTRLPNAAEKHFTLDWCQLFEMLSTASAAVTIPQGK